MHLGLIHFLSTFDLATRVDAGAAYNEEDSALMKSPLLHPHYRDDGDSEHIAAAGAACSAARAPTRAAAYASDQEARRVDFTIVVRAARARRPR